MSQYYSQFDLKNIYIYMSQWPTFHGPVIYFISRKVYDVQTSHLWIMIQYDPKFDLKINVGHSDLHFTVQWFYLITWNIFDA